MVCQGLKTMSHHLVDIHCQGQKVLADLLYASNYFNLQPMKEKFHFLSATGWSPVSHLHEKSGQLV